MRKIVFSVLSVLALLAMVACGGGSSSISTPIPAPPSGGNNAGFSNASLSGSYVFTASGANSGGSNAVLGRFTADGAGNITSGIRDTTFDSGNPTLAEPIIGTYSVNQDGRGQMLLKGVTGQEVYRFVMQSNGSAQLFQVSDANDAVGRFDQQSTVPTAGLILVTGALNYAAHFDGENRSLNPYGAVSQLVFTSTASGTTLSGVLDENDAGTYTAQLALSGSFANPDANGRGTMAFTTTNGMHNLLYYWVSPNMIQMISTDPTFFLTGTAYQQSGIGSLTGDQVFASSGYSSSGPVVETGRFTISGTNLTNGVEDYNENGTYYDSVAISGTLTAPDSTGRWTASLAYSSSTLGVVGYQVSPSQSLIMTTTSSNSNYATVETGTLRAQTIGLSASNITGNYAEALSGEYLYYPQGNVESTGNFSASNGSLVGTTDAQTPSGYSMDYAQDGTYSIDATTGRGTGTIGSIPLRVYAVDANTMYTLSSDPYRLYQGKMVIQ